MNKVKGKYNWTYQDINFLISHYPHTSNKFFAILLGCGWSTIVRKARELNIYKSPEFRGSIDFLKFARIGPLHPNSIATRIKPSEHRGPATEFKRRCVIHNL